MPANLQNARFFKLTTDFPMDKVIYLHSGTYTIPFPTMGATIVIPHGLPFTPLVSGSWDFNSGFTTNYDYGTGSVPSSNPAQPFNVSLDIKANATNIVITPINVSGSSVTVYYRIFGLEPSDSQADIPFTASSGTPFILNTDFNYTKLYLDGIASGLTPSSTRNVNHNLGYPPQVMAWSRDSSGYTSPISITYIQSGVTDSVSLSVGNNTITIRTGSFSSVNRVDYRLYIDETS
jgi:hypothetical protein